ncbi:MAG: hypothetical protein RL757_1470 [Bacteroidota bacterium]|jgi:hypothetical protein
MALSNFFRINMPYGISKNSEGEWMAFNREYKQLGWNSYESSTNVFNEKLYTKYRGLTENKLRIIAGDEKRIIYGEDGKICKIFLYNDGTNPCSHPEYWDMYFKKIKLLAVLERK